MKGLDNFTTFLCVVDSGDFSKASRNLHVTASAISKQIKRLEDELNVTLFDRSTRKVCVTEDGAKIYDCLKKGLMHISEAYNIASNVRNVVSGNISISCPSFISHTILVNAVKDFNSIYPEISFFIGDSNGNYDIYLDKVDICICIGELSDSQLVSRKLFKQNKILVCSPFFIENNYIPSKVDDINNLDCLLFSPEISFQEKWILENLHENKRMSLDIDGKLTSDDKMIIIDSVLTGHGIAFIEAWLVEKYLSLGRLINI